MPSNCPECGGEMVSQLRKKICESCGLTLTGAQYDQKWREIRESTRDSQEDKRHKQKDILNWYLDHQNPDRKKKRY